MGSTQFGNFNVSAGAQKCDMDAWMWTSGLTVIHHFVGLLSGLDVTRLQCTPLPSLYHGLDTSFYVSETDSRLAFRQP